MPRAGVDGRAASRTRTWRTTGLRDFDATGAATRSLALERRCWRTRGFGDFWSYVLVADGSIDIAVEPDGLSVWDLAAPLVVVEAAGGRFTDLEGVHAPTAAARVATNGLLHDEVLAPRWHRRARRRPSGSSMSEVTVGLDIGTSSVKAVAADGDGTVVASARVPARVPRALSRADSSTTRPSRGATARWPRSAALGRRTTCAGVCVSAMVPSLTAVDADGTPLLPGVLYGDERGREGEADDAPATGMEFGGFVRWATAGGTRRRAASGPRRRSPTTRSAARPPSTSPPPRPRTRSTTSRDGTRKPSSGSARASSSSRASRPSGARRAGHRWWCGRRRLLASGCIDGFVEQLVAGADEPGDVLVLLGTTLIVWVVAPHDAEHAAGAAAAAPARPATSCCPTRPRAAPDSAARATPAGSSATGRTRMVGARGPGGTGRAGPGAGVGAVPARRARAA